MPRSLASRSRRAVHREGRDPRDPRAAEAARRDLEAGRGRHADRRRPGRVLLAPDPRHLRPQGDRDRHVHRLQRAVGRRGAARGRQARRLRRERGVDVDRAPPLAGGRRRLEDRPAHRPRHRDAVEAARHRRPGLVRLRVHRRRQDVLRRLLRGLPQARAAERPDRDRQRAVERQGRRSRRCTTTRPTRCARSTRRSAATRASRPACSRSATA